MDTVTSSDGTSIAYARGGHGPPLVLVHGTTADHTRWDPLRPVLERDFTTYAIDRRGRGGSGDSGDYALDREADDIAGIVDSIDGPVRLLGHSYGGLCSLEAAVRTDNLRSLVLYEPPIGVGGVRPDSSAVLTEMDALLDDGRPEEALERFFRDIAGVPPEELEALRSAPNWAARVNAVYTVLREERAAAAYEFDPSRFSLLAVPTLLLSGSESARFLRQATLSLDETLPDSRIVVFEGYAHAAMNTAPDRFVDAVVSFLSSEG